MDLTALMRSPELSLDPPPSLGDTVRRRASRVRRRRRALAAACAVVVLAGGASLVPRGDGSGAPLTVAAPEYGVRDADSGVLRLTTVNRAAVVAWYADGEPCVASIRVKRDIDCEPAPSRESRATFPALFAPDNDALLVDGRQLVAGLVQPGTAFVRVELDDGEVVGSASPVGGVDWPFPAFWAEVPAGSRAVRLTAVGEDGQALGTVELAD